MRKMFSNPMMFSNPALMMIKTAAVLIVMLVAAFAQNGIMPVKQDGRIIFMNREEPSNNPQITATEAAQARAAMSAMPQEETPRQLVYWSNTHHRWVPVPRPSAAAYRNAHSAAAEVETLVARSAKASVKNPPNAAQPLSSAIAENHRYSGNRAIAQKDVETAIEAAAARHKVDANLVRAIIQVESGYNPHAVSRKGAMGLMQLMPSTARQLNVRNPFDVNQNVDGGVRHFKGLLESFNGDLARSLAAYNAGQGAVERNRGVPPYAETRQYVKRITALYGSTTLARSGTAIFSTEIRRTRDADGHWMFSNE